MTRNGKRIVLKIGTGVLTREASGELDHAVLGRLIQTASDLSRDGHRLFIVSSGAVGAGLPAFNLHERPSDDVSLLQACAAVGQARLMQIYDSGFRNFQLQVAQLLLTLEDFQVEKRRLNMSNTLARLEEHPEIIPIINENDSVAVYELKTGDNDRLSVLLATLVGADLLVMLTSVPGLRGPASKRPSDIISRVDDIDAVLDFANGDVGRRSVGGMRSKLEAVRDAVNAGIETVIADGKAPEQLPQLVAGKGKGTRFLPREQSA